MFQSKIITHNQTSITLYPERWGIITSMRIRDTELLYQGMLDDTLHDMTKSVRWGIPILFPNAGFLTDEEKIQSWWNLPQHGFARTSKWNITDDSLHLDSVIPWTHSKDSLTQEVDSRLSGNDEIIQLTQSLSSSDITDMFGYEWQGTIDNTITLSDEWVQLRYSIANNSDTELPISWWLHPYWDVPLGEKSMIQWNFVWGDIVARDIENWSRGGTTRIDTPDDGVVRFAIPGIGTIEIQLTPEFRRLWIWSLPNKNFVCVEPVMWDDGNIVRSPVKIPERWNKSTNIVISLA